LQTIALISFFLLNYVLILAYIYSLQVFK